MKITDLKIPKGKLKGKWVEFYKAFPFISEGEELKINDNIDLFALTKEAALEYELLNTEPNGVEIKKGSLIPFVIISISIDDLKNKDITNSENVYFKNDVISITLEDKEVKVDVVNLRLDGFKKTEDKDGNISITGIKLIEE